MARARNSIAASRAAMASGLSQPTARPICNARRSEIARIMLEGTISSFKGDLQRAPVSPSDDVDISCDGCSGHLAFPSVENPTKICEARLQGWMRSSFSRSSNDLSGGTPKIGGNSESACRPRIRPWHQTARFVPWRLYNIPVAAESMRKTRAAGVSSVSPAAARNRSPSSSAVCTSRCNNRRFKIKARKISGGRTQPRPRRSIRLLPLRGIAIVSLHSKSCSSRADASAVHRLARSSGAQSGFPLYPLLGW